MALMSMVSFTGRCRPMVKEEPKSPTQPANKKHKAESTTDVSAIRHTQTVSVALNPTRPSGKRHKAAFGGPSQVRFNGITVPPTPKATRNSTRATKANLKKDIHKLFEQLGQEFRAVGKTCEEIAESFE
jgi:hypothetical protein